MRAPERSSPSIATPLGSAAPLSNGEATLAIEPEGGARYGHANGSGRGPNGNAWAGSALRHEILSALRQDGPASPDQLAAGLGVSRTGVLQQLRALGSTGLVSRQTVRHGVGRPRHLYDVTPDAQDLFPANYDGLAAGLLAAIDAVGGENLIEEIFTARRRQIADRVRTRFAERLPADAPLADKVRELAVHQDEQGYLCRAELDGAGNTIRLREHNCAIYHVAMRLSAACEAELDLFREVLGADVVRESHIATGDRCCTYRVAELPSH